MKYFLKNNFKLYNFLSIKSRCRTPDFNNIVPYQPKRTDDNPGEVRLDFEAFMLDSTIVESAQLWIHATIKACIQGRDCLPVSY